MKAKKSEFSDNSSKFSSKDFFLSLKKDSIEVNLNEDVKRAYEDLTTNSSVGLTDTRSGYSLQSKGSSFQSKGSSFQSKGSSFQSKAEEAYLEEIKYAEYEEEKEDREEDESEESEDEDWAQDISWKLSDQQIFPSFLENSVLDQQISSVRAELKQRKKPQLNQEFLHKEKEGRIKTMFLKSLFRRIFNTLENNLDTADWNHFEKNHETEEESSASKKIMDSDDSEESDFSDIDSDDYPKEIPYPCSDSSDPEPQQTDI